VSAELLASRRQINQLLN
ncbi:hypothetical protein, partial [Klebsiella pneumoniae]